ncbi:hypothetical protein V2J52_15885 [Georgenia sp. MJ173]|uniref:hypothetical protein n=1 Tax=Georgenia sunbinii TaxID=3117728 RepID=UPI002F26931B
MGTALRPLLPQRVVAPAKRAGFGVVIRPVWVRQLSRMERRPALRIQLDRLDRLGHALEERMAEPQLGLLVSLGRSEQFGTRIGMLGMRVRH